MKKTIAIVHYNTPELTEAAILSMRKQAKEDYQVVIFDNSNERPFKRRMRGVKVINNTNGQLINFDEELAKYPDREPKYAMRSNFGSFKHILTVQKLWELIPESFILMESDVLIKKPFDFIWDEQFAAVGRIQWHQPGNLCDVPRLLPLLCYMNVPLLTANGARYFDPMRCWALQKGVMVRGNWYDTGASLLEDIVRTKPALVCRNYKTLPECYIHYHGGSWRQNNVEEQKAWLEEHKDLWK